MRPSGRPRLGCLRARDGRTGRVRAAWRALVDRIKSLAPCHEPAAESRAALTGREQPSGISADKGVRVTRGRKRSEGERADRTRIEAPGERISDEVRFLCRSSGGHLFRESEVLVPDPTIPEGSRAPRLGKLGRTESEHLPSASPSCRVSHRPQLA